MNIPLYTYVSNGKFLNWTAPKGVEVQTAVVSWSFSPLAQVGGGAEH